LLHLRNPEHCESIRILLTQALSDDSFASDILQELNHTDSLWNLYWKCHSVEILASWTEFLKAVAVLPQTDSMDWIIGAGLSLKLLRHSWHKAQLIVSLMCAYMGHNEDRVIIAISVEWHINIVDYMKDWYQNTLADERKVVDFSLFFDTMCAFAGVLDSDVLEKIVQINRFVRMSMIHIAAFQRLLTTLNE
jgi:hypothetical protein